jgi:hypothetical protein
MSPYADHAQRLLALLRDTFGDQFKAYYDDDPELIPDFNLPCLVVSQLSDATSQGAYGQDDVEEEYVIKVIYNKKDDFDSQVKAGDLTQSKIRRAISSRDPSTGQYEAATVKGALRNYALDGIVAIAPDMSVLYGITPRLEDILTSEGHVTFKITYSVNTI